MSAEVENNKEEEIIEQKFKKNLKEKFKGNWQLGIKLLELLICAICMGFSYDPLQHVGLAKSHMHHIGVMYTAFTGYMLINCVMLISRAIGDTIPYRTASIFAVMGSALFLVTGILLLMDKAYLIQHYNYSNGMYYMVLLQISIGFACVNVVLFAADAVLTFRTQEDF